MIELESLVDGRWFTKDVEAIHRAVEAHNREREQLLRAADASQRELDAMTEMATRMQRWADGFRLPCFDDPIRWP